MQSGLHNLTRTERIRLVEKFTEKSLSAFSKMQVSEDENIIENCVGFFQIPVAVVPRFIMDGQSRPLLLAIEERSVVAGLNSASKWISENSGTVTTEIKGQDIIGQIHLSRDFREAVDTDALFGSSLSFLQDGNLTGKIHITKIRERVLSNRRIVHVYVRPHCYMGANLLNGILDYLADFIGRQNVTAAIISNYCDSRLVKATVQIPLTDITKKISEKIVAVHQCSHDDFYRAVTENKGIMNGIEPLLMITGNDVRAVSAACYAHANKVNEENEEKYGPLSKWRCEEGHLVGTLELPMNVGTRGAFIDKHLGVRGALDFMGIKDNDDLARVAVAAGLVQNLAALKSLGTTGISSWKSRKGIMGKERECIVF